MTSLARKLRRTIKAASPRPAPDTNGMVWLDSGTFRMGSNSHYAEEAPARTVKVSGFWIDRHLVTNTDFARFVGTTGYVTTAERPIDPKLYPGVDPALLLPGAIVFRPTDGPVDLQNFRQWWHFVPGACWHRPEGPGSTIRDKLDHPVVQIAFEDAMAFAEWRGKTLPTEAMWEYAARGGLEEADYCWGPDLHPDGRIMANTWHGRFPYENTAPDGFTRTSVVGSYPANGFGLFDMAGNVWEWTTDWHSHRHAPDAAPNPAKPCCVPENPRGGTREGSVDPFAPELGIPRKTVKGGSFMCSPDYCLRYRPAARQGQAVDTAIQHLGFRCVVPESEP